MFGKADCGLGRIAALTSIGRIADCTLGALQCKDPRKCTMASGVRNLNCAARETTSNSTSEGLDWGGR
eukprot:15059070-Alexandrium_andersonii.AAC.1